MLDAHLEVLPERAGGHAVEAGEHDHDAHLPRCRGLVDDRQEDVAVVLGAQLTRDLEANDAVGQVGQFRDHPRDSRAVTEADRTRWDERHARSGPATPGPPPRFTPYAHFFPTRGHALDLACGRGPGSVWLAARG